MIGHSNYADAKETKMMQDHFVTARIQKYSGDQRHKVFSNFNLINLIIENEGVEFEIKPKDSPLSSYPY
jgi:hypothetical protein